MNKNTKMFKLLKFLYNNRGKKFKAKELPVVTGISEKNVCNYQNHCNEYIVKERINGKWHYGINTHPSKLKYIRQLLIKSMKDGA